MELGTNLRWQRRLDDASDMLNGVLDICHAESTATDRATPDVQLFVETHYQLNLIAPEQGDMVRAEMHINKAPKFGYEDFFLLSGLENVL